MPDGQPISEGLNPGAPAETPTGHVSERSFHDDLFAIEIERLRVPEWAARKIQFVGAVCRHQPIRQAAAFGDAHESVTQRTAKLSHLMSFVVMVDSRRCKK